MPNPTFHPHTHLSKEKRRGRSSCINFGEEVFFCFFCFFFFFYKQPARSGRKPFLLLLLRSLFPVIHGIMTFYHVPPPSPYPRCPRGERDGIFFSFFFSLLLWTNSAQGFCKGHSKKKEGLGCEVLDNHLTPLSPSLLHLTCQTQKRKWVMMMITPPPTHNRPN